MCYSCLCVCVLLQLLVCVYVTAVCVCILLQLLVCVYVTAVCVLVLSHVNGLGPISLFLTVGD